MTTDLVLQHSQRKRISDMRRRAVEAANSRPRQARPPEHSKPYWHSFRWKSKCPPCALRDRSCTSPRAIRPLRFVLEALLIEYPPAADSTRPCRSCSWAKSVQFVQRRQSAAPQEEERAHLSS